MDRRTTIASFSTAAAALLASTFGGRRAAAQGPKKYRAVFDVTADGAERWDGALRNVENLQKALGAESVEVQMVFHGKALGMIQKTNTEHADRLRGLHAKGVRLSACRNSMRRFNVTPEMLFPFADTVDAAVAELVRKQHDGWAYLKIG